MSIEMERDLCKSVSVGYIVTRIGTRDKQGDVNWKGKKREGNIGIDSNVADMSTVTDWLCILAGGQCLIGPLYILTAYSTCKFKSERRLKQYISITAY